MTPGGPNVVKVPALRRRNLHNSAGEAAAAVDLRTTVGSVTLPNPVMTASGTAGHGAELAPYLDLGALGAVVVKSLHAEPWAGNPALRVHETAAGMINSVGLQGPGVLLALGVPEDDLLGPLELGHGPAGF